MRNEWKQSINKHFVLWNLLNVCKPLTFPDLKNLDDGWRHLKIIERGTHYCLSWYTCQTRMTLSVYPAKRVCPSADQAMERQPGGRALEVGLITSSFSSSTMHFSSKSQILIVGPAAAHSQYLLGLKHRALISSAPFSVYRCLPSFRSHNMALPSLPPDAHSEPSGDTVTQFR